MCDQSAACATLLCLLCFSRLMKKNSWVKSNLLDVLVCSICSIFTRWLTVKILANLQLRVNIFLLFPPRSTSLRLTVKVFWPFYG